MALAADLVRRIILVFGELQVVALSCLLMVNGLVRIQRRSELQAGNVLLLHAVVVDTKRKQAIIGGVKTLVAAYQLIFRVIRMAVGPFEVHGFTNWIEPIIVIFFIKDVESQVVGD